MKLVFTLILLVSSLSFANQTIVCNNTDRSEDFRINISTGKILLNNQFEVTGAVYSGVNPNTQYNGEILGEITLNDLSFYITLIVRNADGQLNLEAIWYPKSDSRKVMKTIYEDCTLN